MPRTRIAFALSLAVTVSASVACADERIVRQRVEFMRRFDSVTLPMTEVELRRAAGEPTQRRSLTNDDSSCTGVVGAKEVLTYALVVDRAWGLLGKRTELVVGFCVDGSGNAVEKYFVEF